jgi:hypothetical protein
MHACVHEKRNQVNEEERTRLTKSSRDAPALTAGSSREQTRLRKSIKRKVSSAVIVSRDYPPQSSAIDITFCRDISLRWENKRRNRDTGRRLCLSGRGRRRFLKLLGNPDSFRIFHWKLLAVHASHTRTRTMKKNMKKLPIRSTAVLGGGA